MGHGKVGGTMTDPADTTADTLAEALAEHCRPTATCPCGGSTYGAKALWASVEGDFPGAIHAIHVNEDARQMMSDSRMDAWGFPVGADEQENEHG